MMINRRLPFRRPVPTAIAGVVAACNTAFAQVPADYVPPAIDGLEVKNTLGMQVSTDLAFTTSEGKPITIAEIAARGKPIALVLQYFRCPLLCPQTRSDVIGCLNQIDDFTIGDEFELVFVSFDPRDTPTAGQRIKFETLLQYARIETQPIRDGLHVLTGSGPNTWKLADELGFGFRYLQESGEYSHAPVLYVLTAGGTVGEKGDAPTVSRIFTSLPYDAKDVRFALVEASGGRIGTIFDQVALWCFHWDPAAGAYTLAAMRVMQIGCVLTVVLVGGVLLVMVRHERSKRRRRSAAIHDFDTTRSLA